MKSPKARVEGPSVNPNERLLRFLSATPEQQEAIDRILLGKLSLHTLAAPDEPKGPLLLRVKEAAGLLGVHRATIWRLVKAGRLETVELLGSLRVRRSDIQDLAAGQRAHGQCAAGQRGQGSFRTGNTALAGASAPAQAPYLQGGKEGK